MNKIDNVLDKWIVTRLHEIVRDISVNLELYQIPQAVLPIEVFVDDLSRWYTRRSRERISRNDAAALETMHYVLLTFTKAAAPVIPFITEEIYQNLLCNSKDYKKSVHLEFYPKYDKKLIKANLPILENMKKTRDIVSLALAVRVGNKIAVRQPLSKLYINSKLELPKEYVVIIKDEVNIKEIIFTDNMDLANISGRDTSSIINLDLNITPELKKEGQAREMIRKFQDLRKQNNLQVNDQIKAIYKKSAENDQVIVDFGKEIKEKIYAVSLESGEDFFIHKI